MLLLAWWHVHCWKCLCLAAVDAVFGAADQRPACDADLRAAGQIAAGNDAFLVANMSAIGAAEPLNEYCRQERGRSAVA
jgi:hypothetical protein